jgi:hypothetical protein
VAEAVVQPAHVGLHGVGVARVMALSLVQQGFHAILVGRYFMGAGARHAQRLVPHHHIDPALAVPRVASKLPARRQMLRKASCSTSSASARWRTMRATPSR